MNIIKLALIKLILREGKNMGSSRLTPAEENEYRRPPEESVAAFWIGFAAVLVLVLIGVAMC